MSLMDAMENVCGAAQPGIKADALAWTAEDLPTLAQRVRAEIDENGYTVLRGLLSPEECDKLLVSFDRLTFGPFEDQELRRRLGNNFGDQSQGYGITERSEFRLINVNRPSTYSPDWRPEHNVFMQRCTLLARAVRGRRMCKDYEQFLTKLPRRGRAEFPWHTDSMYWPRRYPAGAPTTTLTFSLALSDADEEAGCLRVVPGSHKGGVVPDALETSNTRAMTMEPPAGASIVHLPVRKGDVTIHEEHIVHGSAGNVSDAPRKTVVMAFRDERMIAYERSIGFSHSYNDDATVISRVRQGKL